MAEFALICAGSAIMLVILGYVFYTVFFPLLRTMAGGIQVLSTHGSRRSKASEGDKQPSFFAADPELGPTMADGGEKTKKQD